jgi:uncharacterized membrane protein
MLSRFAGAVAGLVVGVILIQFGFWEAVFLVACMGIGWWVGTILSKEVNLGEWVGRYVRGGRWRR